MLSKCKLPLTLIAIQLAMGLLASPAKAHTTDAYQWANVPVGGGGAIPNFIFHPKVQNLMYIGADVGGLDRWDQPTQQWIPLLDWLRRDEFNMYGVESVAVDPSDTTGNVVYVGTGYANWATKGELMKSTDRGTTWIRNGVKITGNSNGDQGNSERIAVDPNNNQVVYYASQDGLFRSTDGNTTLGLLAGAPTGNTSMILIDPTSGTVTGPTRTKRIYLQPPTGALNVSNDGGNTWSAISGAPSGVNRAVISSAGTLFCTGSNAVWKYSGGIWSNISPTATGYMCVDIDPLNNNNLVVAEGCGNHGCRSWRSSNAGATWTQISNTSSSNPGWLLQAPDNADSSTFNIKFNPFVSGEVWLTDWYSPWKTTNIWATTVAYTAMVTGHEETVQQPALISPPSGATFLYSGVADVNGFAHRSLTYPNFPIQIRFPTWFNINGADFQESNPSFAAFVGISGWQGSGAGGYTTDAGTTYTQFGSLPGSTNNGGRVAITATSGRIIWATGSGNVYYSDNKGGSWTQSNGAPSNFIANQLFNYYCPLVSDRVNNSKVYIYNGGNIYRSTDSGANFSIVKSGLPGANNGDVRLIVNFATEGDLWLSLADNGLYHSTDSGSTWAQLTNVQSAFLASFGKGPSAGTSSLYIMGKVDSDATEGIFRSDDHGATWAKIDIANPYPGDQANTMCGDRQTYGQVYVGSQIGILYGKKGAGAPPAPGGLTATAGNTQVVLSWTASSGATSYNVYRGTTAGGESTTAIATGIATTSYTNTGLTNGTTYYYYVKAVNALGTSGASNEASAQPFAPVPQAQIASGTAVIDGNVDAAWGNATVYPLTKSTGTLPSSHVLSATWQGLWDSTNLYILATVTDDVLLKYVTNPWEGDSVELYIDSTNSKTTTYGATDFQYEFPWNSTVVTETKHSPGSLTGVTFAQVNITGGYRIEAKLPWATLGVTPAANNLVGIDVHINNADTVAGTRDGKLEWNDGTDQSWGNPSLFGTGKLNAANPPAAPTGLTATPGNAQVALSWTASTGATSYNVKRSTVNGSGYATVSSPTVTNYTNTGLTNGTTYYFVVTAVNASGESGNSNQASATPSAGGGTLGGSVAGPSASANLTTLGTSDWGHWGLGGTPGWDHKSSGGTQISNYTVVGTGTPATNGSMVTSYSWTDGTPTGSNAGTTTGLTLGGVNNGYSITAPADTTQRTITIYVGGWLGTGTLTAHLSDGSASDYVNATQGSATTSYNSVFTLTYKAASASKTLTVTWKTTTDNSGNNSCNDSLQAAYLTTSGSAPSAPTGLTATAGNTQVVLNWTASTGATSYNVYRGTTAGGESTTAIATGIAATTYTNTGLTNGTTYFYKVKAVNANGTSAYSNEASATPISPNVHTGTWACKGVLTGTPGHTICAQITGASPSQTYVASLWIKGTGSVNLHVYHGSWGAELPVTQCTATGTWQKITTAPFSTGTDTNVTFSIQDDFTTAGTVYIDDAFIGVANGTNMLVNPGFESGNTTWNINAPFSIVQNP